jgi:hypothetical protein
LLMWLKDYATKRGCLQLHLDAGVQRNEAHRFYGDWGQVFLWDFLPVKGKPRLGYRRRTATRR